jgi:Spy/CpxP family protein refolding chaperone
MRNSWLLGCACVLAAGRFSIAAETTGAMAASLPAAATQSGSGRALIRGDYAMMVQQLQPDPNQVERMIEILKARKSALAAWVQVHGKRLDELERLVKLEPAGSAAAKQARAERKELQADRKKLLTEYRGQILTILTDEQLLKWESFDRYRKVARKFAWTGFDRKAQDKMRALCEAAAKKLHGLTDRDARDQILDQLGRDMENQVLSDDQRRELQERRSRKLKAATQKGPASQPAAESPDE